MEKFITLEGVEGAGKSTQLKKIGKYLKDKEIEALLLREPGGTPLGEALRKILLKEKDLKIDSKTETILMMASRRELLIQKIFPALKENKIVLCDRFIDSTIAYQGYGRGVEEEWIRKIFDLICFNFYPKLTIFLDIDISKSFERLKKKKRDRFEGEDLEFHKRVQKGFRELAKKEKERIVTINGEGKKDEIFERILSCLKERFII